MKVVRIFLGGSVVKLQGDGDRKGYRPSVIDPLISSLNSRKSAQELFVVKSFADLEHEAKPGGQQRLFNRYLTKDADIAIFILENVIGSHSSEELELALSTRHKWEHPLVYIYGKDIDEDSELIRQLNNRELYYEPFYNTVDLEGKIRHDLLSHPRFRTRLFPRQEAKEGDKTDKINKSIIFKALLVLLFILWGVGQYYYYSSTYSLVQKRTSPQKERGLIYGDQGEILSYPEIKYDLYLDCSLIRGYLLGEVDKFSSALATVSKRPPEEYKELIVNGIHVGRKYLRLCQGIDNNSLNLVSNASFLGTSRALIVEINSTSNHPFGNLASRTIGQSSVYHGYGLEQSYLGTLNGCYGYKTAVRRRNGSITDIYDLPLFPRLLFSRDYTYSSATNGVDLHTSLDMCMQAVADSVLRNATDLDPAFEGACLMVMDVHKGAIKTIVNLNRNPDNGKMEERWNVSIAYMLNPGNLFDPVLFTSMLSSGSINHEDVKDVLSGKKHLSSYLIDISPFLTYLQNFRLSESYPFDIKGWAKPHIPEESPISIASGKLSYDLLITPLHLLSFYNTVANNGEYCPPYLVKYNGDWNYEDKTYKTSRLFTKDNADYVKDYLMTSANPYGYRNECFHILGQTSMNRISVGSNKIEYQPSFIGFFPDNNPVYSVACMLYTKPTQPTSKYNDLPSKVVCELVKRLNEMETSTKASTDW